MQGIVRGPLFTPKVGTAVTVYWVDGVVLTGTVGDHLEDGTGYVVNDAVVYPADVDHVVVYP